MGHTHIHVWVSDQLFSRSLGALRVSLVNNSSLNDSQTWNQGQNLQGKGQNNLQGQNQGKGLGLQGRGQGQEFDF